MRDRGGGYVFVVCVCVLAPTHRHGWLYQLDDAAARNVELPEGQVGRCAHKVLIYDLYT